MRLWVCLFLVVGTPAQPNYTCPTCIPSEFGRANQVALRGCYNLTGGQEASFRTEVGREDQNWGIRDATTCGEHGFSWVEATCEQMSNLFAFRDPAEAAASYAHYNTTCAGIQSWMSSIGCCTPKRPDDCEDHKLVDNICWAGLPSPMTLNDVAKRCVDEMWEFDECTGAHGCARKLAMCSTDHYCAAHRHCLKQVLDRTDCWDSEYARKGWKILEGARKLCSDSEPGHCVDGSMARASEECANPSVPPNTEGRCAWSLAKLHELHCFPDESADWDDMASWEQMCHSECAGVLEQVANATDCDAQSTELVHGMTAACGMLTSECVAAIHALGDCFIDSEYEHLDWNVTCDPSHPCHEAYQRGAAAEDCAEEYERSFDTIRFTCAMLDAGFAEDQLQGPPPCLQNTTCPFNQGADMITHEHSLQDWCSHMCSRRESFSGCYDRCDDNARELINHIMESECSCQAQGDYLKGELPGTR